MNNYNPNIHHRHSIRMKGYDYSQSGLYFITICVNDRHYLFGEIKNDEMLLNDFGNIAYRHCEKLPEQFPNIIMDVFQIMPNHMHAIILVGATLAVALTADNAVAPDNGIAYGNAVVPDNMVVPVKRAGASPAPTAKPKTLGDIVGAYKSLVANDCLKIWKQKYDDKLMGKLWQRNYYEHIIRDDQSYQRIYDYIINNPKNWNADKLYNL